MSQESEQAQEAWRQRADLHGWLAKGAYLRGQSELKSAVKAEIEYEINKLEDTEKHGGLTEVGKERLKQCRWFLSLLDTVTPI